MSNGWNKINSCRSRDWHLHTRRELRWVQSGRPDLKLICISWRGAADAVRAGLSRGQTKSEIGRVWRRSLKRNPSSRPDHANHGSCYVQYTYVDEVLFLYVSPAVFAFYLIFLRPPHVWPSPGASGILCWETTRSVAINGQKSNEDCLLEEFKKKNAKLKLVAPWCGEIYRGAVTLVLVYKSHINSTQVLITYDSVSRSSMFTTQSKGFLKAILKMLR